MVKLNCKLKNKAFSLLELIISVAILSAGIVVILQALAFSARVTGLSCDLVNAVFLAEDKMQELEFNAKQNPISEENVKDKKDKFAWEYSISSDLDYPNLLYKLNLEVSWERLNRKEALNLSTYYLKQ